MKAVGAGDDEDRGLDDAIEDAGASSNSTAPPPSLTEVLDSKNAGGDRARASTLHA